MKFPTVVSRDQSTVGYIPVEGKINPLVVGGWHISVRKENLIAVVTQALHSVPLDSHFNAKVDGPIVASELAQILLFLSSPHC